MPAPTLKYSAFWLEVREAHANLVKRCCHSTGTYLSLARSPSASDASGGQPLPGVIIQFSRSETVWSAKKSVLPLCWYLPRRRLSAILAKLENTGVAVWPGATYTHKPVGLVLLNSTREPLRGRDLD